MIYNTNSTVNVINKVSEDESESDDIVEILVK